MLRVEVASRLWDLSGRVALLVAVAVANRLRDLSEEVSLLVAVPVAWVLELE